MIYEWDPKKARSNLRIHRVAFEKAATVFLDPFAVTYPDPDHSHEEDREITIGYSAKQRLLFVSALPTRRSSANHQCLYRPRLPGHKLRL